MALLYLVNKPQVFSKITRWLLLFLEYDFKNVYKPGRSHLMVDALSRLLNKVDLVGVPSQTTDVHMFTYIHSGYRVLWLPIRRNDAMKIHNFIETIFNLES
jgi:hypothetical protein